MFRTILLPIDGSDLTEAILPHLIDLARPLQARVVLLHALPTLSAMLLQPGGVLGASGDAAASVEIATQSIEAEREAAESLLAAIRTRLEQEGIACESEIREGDPARTILEVAAEKEVDLIAMATHGRAGLGRLLLGSVADEVVRNPPHLPVLLVRTEA